MTGNLQIVGSIPSGSFVKIPKVSSGSEINRAYFKFQCCFGDDSELIKSRGFSTDSAMFQSPYRENSLFLT